MRELLYNILIPRMLCNFGAVTILLQICLILFGINLLLIGTPFDKMSDHLKLLRQLLALSGETFEDELRRLVQIILYY